MTPTVLLVGGGTGGHIHPLLAVAERLRETENENAGLRLVALCSQRPIDADVLRAPLAQGLIDAVVPLPAQPLAKSPRAIARLVRAWSPSVALTRREIERSAGPVVAVSTGGFVSVPASRACRQLGVPQVLIALDVPPGKATAWIARHAERRLNAAPAHLAGWERTGPIIRAAARPPADLPSGPADHRDAARERLGLDPGVRTLVVFGGSQGARTVNRFVHALFDAHADAFAGWQVLHQAGARDIDEAVRAAAASAVDAHAVAFVDRVGDAWSAADLVLGRSGAGTVAEATLARTPCLFMPYPFHADRHQAGNARALVAAGAAVILDDQIEPDANLRAHGPTVRALLSDPDRLAAMAARAAALEPPADGAAAVAAAVRGLVARGGGGTVR